MIRDDKLKASSLDDLRAEIFKNFRGDEGAGYILTTYDYATDFEKFIDAFTSWKKKLSS